ncbi:transposase, partial [Shigella dysenteriae]
TLKSPSYTKSVSWQHYQNAVAVADFPQPPETESRTAHRYTSLPDR